MYADADGSPLARLPIAYASHKLRDGRKKRQQQKWMPLKHTHVPSNFTVCNL